LQRPQRIIAELQASRILRAVYSERQLQEVMVDFWTNHFNIFAGKDRTRFYLPEFEAEVIRPNALGFGDVKLALLMGLFLGWGDDYLNSVRLVLIALVLGCLIGLAIGALLFVVRKLTGRDWLPDPLVEAGELAPQSGLFGTTFPFGPALAIGAAIGVLFAPQLLG